MPKAQRGVSKLGLLMTFLLITSFLTFGLKVGPLYIDDNVITGVCNDLIETGEIDDMNVRDLRTRVNNSLRINNVTDFDTSAITLARENGQAIITIEYERRVELIANLDVVARFNHRIL
jgi:hypothetical protein